MGGEEEEEEKKIEEEKKENIMVVCWIYFKSSHPVESDFLLSN